MPGVEALERSCSLMAQGVPVPSTATPIVSAPAPTLLDNVLAVVVLGVRKALAERLGAGRQKSRSGKREAEDPDVAVGTGIPADRSVAARDFLASVQVCLFALARSAVTSTPAVQAAAQQTRSKPEKKAKAFTITPTPSAAAQSTGTRLKVPGANAFAVRYTLRALDVVATALEEVRVLLGEEPKLLERGAVAEELQNGALCLCFGCTLCPFRLDCLHTCAAT